MNAIDQQAADAARALLYVDLIAIAVTVAAAIIVAVLL